MIFCINNIEWEIFFVSPENKNLLNSRGLYTLGVCDNNRKAVFLNNKLSKYMLEKVLCHELTHCFCFSYDIHIPIEEEEFMADWLSVYGKDLIFLLDNLMNSLKMRVAT